MLLVACFTTEGNLLSQWRSYCPTGRGCSLGFSAEAVLKAANDTAFRLVSASTSSSSSSRSWRASWIPSPN